MSEQSAAIYDDKSQVRGHLDLSRAQWRLAAPDGADPAGDFYEVAFVEHTDGVTYTVLRKAREPEGKVLVYTPAEWRAFLDGVEDGEFDDFLEDSEER
ncbi:DUF397 domain-containing protein [Amycolatopsis sp. cmx-4-61]|uniref:DUF397 domain-containing protein n=1 Tax=Amycolatopsis sp. cmx-4-61 TaxID=2790937 RepID=UPI0039796F53